MPMPRSSAASAPAARRRARATASRGTTAAASRSAPRVPAGVGNPLELNRTFFNGGLGIDLGSAGVTPNDSKDGDAGANGLQNFPTLGAPTLSADGTSASFSVHLNSIPFVHFKIVYYN